MTSSAFVDSGAFIAFLVASDRCHREVIRLFARPPRELCTSVLVVSEAYGWFLHRTGEEGARRFRALLERLPIEILDADADHRAATWKKLDQLRGRKLTYVDASSLVWVGARSIRNVWGTDHHLSIEGAKVIPGPPVL